MSVTEGRPEVRLRGKRRLFAAWMPEGSGRVLDVGCAYSFMLDFLAGSDREGFGLEYDVAKLVEARRRFPHRHFACASGEALPLEAGSMDVVTFFEVLEHVEDERGLLQEIHRVLAPGGVILMSVPNAGAVEWMDMDNLVFTPALALGRRLGFFRGVSDYYLRHHRHYTVERLRALFAGLFEIDRVYYGGLAANQLGFLVYKSANLALRLAGLDERRRVYRWLERAMDHVTSWDFDHSYGPSSDKLCVRARQCG